MLSWAGPRKFVVDARKLTTRKVPDVFARAADTVRNNPEVSRVAFVASPFDSDRSDRFRRDGHVASRCVEGLVKSLAKEVGRKGATVNLLWAGEKWESDELALPLGLVLDDTRFGFMTGQAVALAPEPQPAVRAAASFPPVDGHEAAVGKAVDAGWAGKTVAVTGASGGIGQAVSLWCRQRGATVMELDLPHLQTAATSSLQRQVPLDLLSESSVEEAAAVLADAVPLLDGLVHCAGITRDRSLAKMPAEDWAASLAVNLFHPMRFTDLLIKSKTLAPRTSVAPGSTMVSISSVIGFAGNFGQTHYAAGKMGMRTWVEELSAQKKIPSYAVAPGYIQTPMTAAMPPEILTQSAAQSALNRMGQPAEIAHVVGTLLSPLGKAFNPGQTLRVCGGHFMGS